MTWPHDRRYNVLNPTATRALHLHLTLHDSSEPIIDDPTVQIKTFSRGPQHSDGAAVHEDDGEGAPRADGRVRGPAPRRRGGQDRSSAAATVSSLYSSAVSSQRGAAVWYRSGSAVSSQRGAAVWYRSGSGAASERGAALGDSAGQSLSSSAIASTVSSLSSSAVPSQRAAAAQGFSAGQCLLCPPELELPRSSRTLLLICSAARGRRKKGDPEVFCLGESAGIRSCRMREIVESFSMVVTIFEN